ncbi:MAG: hypothetical protein ACI8T1_000767 [Verrucomicrobiales bacterium]|jgi:hypothetical protein
MSAKTVDDYINQADHWQKETEEGRLAQWRAV